MASRTFRRAAASPHGLALAGLVSLLALSSARAAGPGDATTSKSEDATVTKSGDSEKPLPFRNSIFLFEQSVTPETINSGLQLSPLPSYQWWLSLRPRW